MNCEWNFHHFHSVECYSSSISHQWKEKPLCLHGCLSSQSMPLTYVWISVSTKSTDVSGIWINVMRSAARTAKVSKIYVTEIISPNILEQLCNCLLNYRKMPTLKT